ncbi:DNA-3-methyladenine glycosylase I [Gandjariella thermophila]|uniref:DNA-3-methyladenine glycosylase I n=1 Tax=Gandjariella thermophila TaxID=1931992 RepID=A0A4D4J4E2_9PSEU|nr:DNA-3-methyladenine glycosylase I [Gandjariella thermophila]GDY29980.1 DNA-3-methyladenine glycosylase I [Gandjariella thermophila]
MTDGVAEAAAGLVVGEDGRTRCAWGGSTPDYAAYHDDEWGVPLRGEAALFERLCLEAFQSGLSWLTILRKREAFRRAFAGFDPAAMARFDERDVERLLTDASIIRNRAKIEASVRNARAVTDLDRPLDELLWSFAPDPEGRPRPRTLGAVPAVTPQSTAMAKELKRRGFVYVGPTTCYALMQATGMVDDHLVGCWRAGGR